MRLLFLLFAFIPFVAAAQITDDFSDGDFTSNPTWTGDAAQFEVNSSGQLHLNSLVADTSSLVTSSTWASNAEWRFWVKLSFATSANNNARFYLISDQANIEGSLNGYFVQVGESNDSIALYRQNGATKTRIIAGTIAYTNNSTNTLRIKVTRDASGLWSLYSDPLGGYAYQLEGTTTDNTFTASAYMGVFCKYTVSNATKFYFDDIYAGPIVVDVTAPSIISVDVISNTQLDVHFSEIVDISTAENPANYSANNGIGNPVTATRDAVNQDIVHLVFTNAFVNGTTNTLTVNNVKDLAGNTISAASSTFVYYIVQNYDVLINELMVDPDPPVGLPNYEYIELINTTPYPIRIDNWTIAAGSTMKTIPSYTILPDSFAVLTSSTAAPFFPASVPVVAMSSFPSLTNTGQTLVLRTNTGAVISTVSYTDEWYRDAVKANGGWSLEQTDPGNPCAGEDNWKASVDPTGGTPGRRNSVLASNPDAVAPQLLRVSVITPDTIEAFFSESIDSTTMLNLSIYAIDNGIGNPVSADAAGPTFNSIKLALGTSLQPSIIYTLTVANTITDCKGNVIGAANSTVFAIPQAVAPNDIVINEILADPKDGGVDFVEIYNRSNKVIDLRELLVSSQDTITGSFTEVESIYPSGFLIFPGDYYVLSENGAAIRAQYSSPGLKAFIDLPNLPSMNIDGDVVVLSNQAGTIIDKLVYTSDMHFPLLNETKGVSLERIDYDRPSSDRSNWHSAAESAGFATPGYKNSQYNDAEVSDDAVTVSPEIFSPDNDSYNDVASISYHFDSPGMVANVSIYDSRGRLVRALVKNELLGASGTFSWDGVNDEREKARIGMYIVYFEAFDTQGNLKHYKRTLVLAGKL
jgi:hypothetical protein